MTSKEIIAEWFRSLQDSICIGLEELDGKATFTEDKWERPGGGGGRTRVLVSGNVFEKGGVNFSAVFGEAPDFLLKEVLANKHGASVKDNPASFFATGVSLVIHPQSPMVPIIHMNVRYLEVSSLPGRGNVSWFGGGIDLTPVYIDESQAKRFHLVLKEVCSQFSPDYYPRFRDWADDYFYIPHRQETRGVGGIFFDRLVPDHETSLEQRFDFVKAVGQSFLPVYSEIVQANRNLPYGEREKQWQLLRRGRYAEFNLVYDRGTKFGLQTDGRTESILMSLPPLASWTYNFVPEAGSAEEQTQNALKKGMNRADGA